MNTEEMIKLQESPHNLSLLKLIKAEKYSFMNCTLCGFSKGIAVLVRSKHCSIFICEKCAAAVHGEFACAEVTQ